MPNTSTAQTPPVQICARLLQELHELIAAGQGDSAEADTIRDKMDPLWELLTKQERSRIRGLSEDLHALKAGVTRQTDMTADEAQQWKNQLNDAYLQIGTGDEDAALGFFRQPFPRDISSHTIAFLQARAWEALGDLEIALLFMKEAERLDPTVSPAIPRTTNC